MGFQGSALQGILSPNSDEIIHFPNEPKIISSRTSIIVTIKKSIKEIYREASYSNRAMATAILLYSAGCGTVEWKRDPNPFCGFKVDCSNILKRYANRQKRRFY